MLEPRQGAATRACGSRRCAISLGHPWPILRPVDLAAIGTTRCCDRPGVQRWGTSGEPSLDFGAERELEACAVACQAHQEDAGPFKDVCDFEPSCVEGPHVQALQKRRDVCLCLGTVARDERIQTVVVSNDVAEDRIECLNDVCALGGGGGDLLRH